MKSLAVVLLAFSSVTAAVVLTLLAVGGPPADAGVTLSDLQRYPDGPPQRLDTSGVRFAVAAVLSPRATLENYEALRQYLGERLGLPVEIVLGKSYAEINSLVRSGDVAFALVCSGAYVVGRWDFGMEALAVPVVDGQKTYRSYLIVPAGSAARTWADLRGKTFAFTDPLSNSGRLVPVYMLYEQGLTPESFFKGFIFTYAHDKSIQAVGEGIVDGAAVDSLVYDSVVKQDPQLAAKTRVIWRSPAYGISPVVASPRLEPELRLRILNAFLEMGSTREGQDVLRNLGVDSFALPEPGAYDEIERMIRATGR